MDSDRGPDATPAKCDGDDSRYNPTHDFSLNILLIDDMKHLLLILANGLTRYGQTVFTALSGPEGLVLFKTHPIDVVICDLSMEGMDGWDVCESIQEICAELHRAKPMFILMTGWACDISDDEARYREGVDMVLEKPVEMSTLMKVLHEFSASLATSSD